MMKKPHAQQKHNESNNSPIPSAGAAINPQSHLAKKAVAQPIFKKS